MNGPPSHKASEDLRWIVNRLRNEKKNYWTAKTTKVQKWKQSRAEYPEMYPDHPWSDSVQKSPPSVKTTGCQASHKSRWTKWSPFSQFPSFAISPSPVLRFTSHTERSEEGLPATSSRFPLDARTVIIATRMSSSATLPWVEIPWESPERRKNRV